MNDCVKTLTFRPGDFAEIAKYVGRKELKLVQVVADVDVPEGYWRFSCTCRPNFIEAPFPWREQ